MISAAKQHCGTSIKCVRNLRKHKIKILHLTLCPTTIFKK